jgi:hypothetical protein
MRSAGGTYDMKEVECRFMRNNFMVSRLKMCLLDVSGVIMLSSLNINFLLSMVPSVLMKHHELLMSQ